MTLAGEREDEYLLDAPLSEERKRAFLTSYVKDRATSGTLEKLFRKLGGFQRVSTNLSNKRGFNTLVHKGPFVAESNWVDYLSWDFAVPMERGILAEFEKLIRECVTPTETVKKSWDEILRKIDQLEDEANRRGYRPSLIILAGDLTIDFLVEFDLQHLGLGSWQLPPDLHGGIWLHGDYKDKPILLLRESDLDALYLVDLARFAAFRRDQSEIEFELIPIDKTLAEDLLGKNPDIVKPRKGAPDNRDERLRELRLRAWLKLFESYEIDRKDCGAVQGTLLA